MPKIGLYIGDADDYAGEVVVADIGIPSEEVASLETPLAMTDSATVATLFRPREPASHKGTYGHVAVVAGNVGKLGAGYLASMAALRAGAGLVTYYLPERSFEKFDARYPEIMCHPLPDKGRGHFHPDGLKELADDLDKKSVVALGPALGTADDTRSFVNGLIDATALPLVIDADGLNVLDIARARRRPAPTVLTPHPAEFGRLIGRSTDDVQKDRVPLAMKFAGENKVHLILKGRHTVTATADGRLFINPTGNPAMASAGMGDALTGLVAGLIAQGIDPAMAAVAGAYLHGLAGDVAADEVGDRGVVASDVIKRIPRVLRMTVEVKT
jgi:NAD(P)H-hydrate epimerase